MNISNRQIIENRNEGIIETSRQDCFNIIEDLKVKHDELYSINDMKWAKKIAKLIDKISRDLLDN